MELHNSKILNKNMYLNYFIKLIIIEHTVHITVFHTVHFRLKYQFCIKGLFIQSKLTTVTQQQKGDCGGTIISNDNSSGYSGSNQCISL